MITITKEQLKAISPRAKDAIITDVAKYMTQYMEQYGVNTPLRVSHFIAQCCHESDGFVTLEEYASGAAYEGRKDLGNIKKGDGKRFKGRGMIQLTGRANYRQFGKNIGVDLEANPLLAMTPENSVRLALEFWKVKGLNAYADKDDITTITHRINGGENGLVHRIEYLKIAKRVLAAAVIVAGVSATPSEAKNYKVNQPALITAIKHAEPLAKVLSDDAIILEFRKRLPPGLKYENQILYGLNKGTQAYKDFVAKNPHIDLNAILVEPVTTPVSVTPPVVTPPTPSVPEIPSLAKIGDNGDYVKEIQALLNSKTGSKLTVDGDYGKGTAKVVTDYQTKNGLTVTGTITNETLDKLRG